VFSVPEESKARQQFLNAQFLNAQFLNAQLLFWALPSQISNLKSEIHLCDSGLKSQHGNALRTQNSQ